MLDLNDIPPPTPPAERHDLDLIVERLRETAETWVPRLFPCGKRSGRDWRLANIRGDRPKRSGSCVISLRGPHAGDWHDFDGNHGGGPVSAIEHATGLTGRALIERAADMAGVLPVVPGHRRPPARSLPTASSERDSAAEIARILADTSPIADSLAEAYLAGRGLAIPTGADLLCHAGLMNWEAKRAFPALVGCVRNAAGETIGLHRTWLGVGSDGRVGKAPVDKPKKMLGNIGGGAVRLAPPPDAGQIAICEGIETGLAVMAACPGLTVWATLSTSGLQAIILPDSIRSVIILADNDDSGAGQRAATVAQERLTTEGREVVIAMPPEKGEDFDDFLRRAGAEAVARVIADATGGSLVQQTGRHKPLGFPKLKEDRPIIRADEGDLAVLGQQVWNILHAANRPPWMFRLAGVFTWVVPDDDGRPVAVSVDENRLRHVLARVALWLEPDKNGALRAVPPPMTIVRDTIATPDADLPILRGIVNAPVYGRNKTLLTAPGYHPDAQLLYVPDRGFTLPEVPRAPSRDEIASARALICEELLGDFPFTGVSERAHVVALLLLGFLRGMIDGPTPLHLIEKPTPGTGASMMVDILSIIISGQKTAIMTEGGDEEEWRKRITAKLMQLPSIVLIDNMRRKLDSANVAAVLTATEWEDRLLGGSMMVRVPNRAVWIATGNNPELSNEIARRTIRIRLDARVEQPWLRTGFRHADLPAWVRENRARLVAACLTFGQAWIAAGCPSGPRTIGSYENWSRTIGGVLETAGIPGFLGNVDEVVARADTESAGWIPFIEAWWEQFRDAEVVAADVYDLAMNCDPGPPVVAGNSDRAQRTAFGMALVKLRDRVFSIGELSVQIQPAGTFRRAMKWQLKPVGTFRSGIKPNDRSVS